MAFNILAINPGHNGSAALVSDGEIVFYGEEERFSKMKYDGNPFKAMLAVLQNFPVDELVIGGTTEQMPSLTWTNENPYTALVRKYNPDVKTIIMGGTHHLGHAANAFYNSGFKTAAAVVVDGAGSYHTEKMGKEDDSLVTGGFETESIFACSYPANFTPIYKRYAAGDSIEYDNGVRVFDDTVTITKAYEAVTDYLGFHFIEAGKTMGLAPYGHYDENIPPLFVQDRGNKNMLRPNYPAGAYINENRFPYLMRHGDPKAWHNDETMIDQKVKNIAWHVQQETQQLVAKLIQKAHDDTGETNIVLSGGFALNCVANYFYKKQFPNLNIYVDPLAHDGGTAIGLARLSWFTKNPESKPQRLKNLYLSSDPNYDDIELALEKVDIIKSKDVTYEDVAGLLEQGNIVALFGGRAEGGPRALGNRSILFDPRVKDGKAIVNKVKGREWFRPFAGSVLKEHAKEWFDLAGMDESPFMMYAVDVQKDKLDVIPSITHVDGTCRVQTVSEEDNKHYYNLIKAFYDKTGVPIVFNTSFNLAGDPLVENVIDAVDTIVRSDIKYLYFPEVGKLIYKDDTVQI